MFHAWEIQHSWRYEMSNGFHSKQHGTKSESVSVMMSRRAVDVIRVIVWRVCDGGVVDITMRDGEPPGCKNTELSRLHQRIWFPLREVVDCLSRRDSDWMRPQKRDQLLISRKLNWHHHRLSWSFVISNPIYCPDAEMQHRENSMHLHIS